MTHQELERRWLSSVRTLYVRDPIAVPGPLGIVTLQAVPVPPDADLLKRHPMPPDYTG
ncbi:hypothetical protein R69619_00401 [Paraburkholderia nemoris]|nr:hypothetical protein R69619_00401 [Paraburkholderia nemoris]